MNTIFLLEWQTRGDYKAQSRAGQCRDAGRGTTAEKRGDGQMVMEGTSAKALNYSRGIKELNIRGQGKYESSRRKHENS